MDRKNWLTLLVEDPRLCCNLMMDPQVGVIRLLEETYGEMVTDTCKDNLLACMRRDLAPRPPHRFVPNLARLHILTAVATDEPVKNAFRRSMKSPEEVARFDTFHSFLVVQIRALNTRPFEADNAVAFVDNFIQNVLMRGWYMGGMAYMRDNSIDEDRVSAPGVTGRRRKK